jgi:hypothetical protein
MTITAAFDRDSLEPLFTAAAEHGITFSNFSFDDCGDLTLTVHFSADFTYGAFIDMLCRQQLDELADYIG